MAAGWGTYRQWWNAVLFAFVLCFPSLLKAQNYNMGNLGTINGVCSGNFYDSQGPATNYQNNENYTATFCAPAGQYLVFTFTSFNTELGADVLTIFSGPNTASPVIGAFSGNGSSPGVVTSTLGGCLTFVFTSDGSIRRAGWAATISCSATPPNNGGDICNSANPFCTSNSYTFPNNTNNVGLGTINCLLSTPNPVWYYFQIQNGGNLIIDISQQDAFSNPIDVDFNLWGPFTSLADGCAQIQAGTAPNVDCSFSASATEQAVINGALPGQVYIMLLTNFSNLPGTITFGAGPGSTATTNCNILCNISGVTATPSVCNPVNNQYSVSGQVTFTNPPSSGNLVITSSCGGSVSIPGPWTSPVNYNLTGLSSSGAACSITASFSADPTCIAVQPYTSPAPCGAGCVMTSITRVPGTCVSLTNSYTLTGVLSFTNPPASGTLTITSSCGGSQVFNAPFVSPVNYSIASLPANGAACTVTATFSATPSCTISGNYTAPAACNAGPCGTNAGTTTVTYSGSSIVPNVICSGGSINITSNDNYILPSPGCFFCTSGLMYAIYTNGGPTGPDPFTDPNFSTYFWTGEDFTTATAAGWNVNNGGAASALGQIIPNPSNQWCFVPITMDDIDFVDYDADLDGCFALGTPICFQFLNPINASVNSGCTGIQTITLTGGYPQFYGGNFTVTNTGAGSISATTVAHGGSFQITGLTLGQTWSFSVTDAGGCVRTFSGVVNNLLDVSINTPSTSICLGNCVTLTATPSTYTGLISFSNNTPVPIPDGYVPPFAGTPAAVGGTWAVSPIQVSNVCPSVYTNNGASIVDFIRITFNINHTYNSDLVCYLQAPSGLFMRIFANIGGATDNFTNTRIASFSVNPINTGAAPYNNNYIPQTPVTLTALSGQAINGVWKLWVGDQYDFDAGTLLNWSIEFSNNPVLSYAWSPAAGLSATNIAAPNACPTVNTNYTVTVTDNCGCSDNASKLIEVEPPNSASISYPGAPFCTSETNPQAVLQTGNSGGIYSSTPAGLSINSTTGAINPSLSTPGTYTVNYNILAGVCPAFTTPTTVTIISSPSAGGNGTVSLCTNGAPVNLFSFLTGTPNTGGTWTGPSVLTGAHLGTFDPATASGGVYTYTINACGTVSATVTVNLSSPPNAGTNGSTTICSTGSNINLFTILGGTPAAGGTWTGPSVLGGGSLGIFTPGTSLAGTYTYTVTGTAPCTNATATVSVTVNPAPNAGTNGSTTICSTGSNINLFTILGGTPAAGGTWTGPSALGGGSLGTFTPGTSVAGTYTYTVTGTAPCTNATATVSVTVNPATNAGTNGTTTICSNGSNINLFTILGGTPAAGGTWTGPSALGGGSLGTFTPGTSLAGTYTYTVTGTAPCTNATATVSVTVNPAPNAGTNGSTTICSTGSNINLFTILGGTPSAGGTWTGPSALGGGSLGTFTPGTNVAGTYTYTVTGTAPCVDASATVTVSLSASPSATIQYPGSPYCTDQSTSQSVILTGTAGGTYSAAPAGLSLNAATGAITPSSSVPGTYTVTYTIAASGGCAAFSTSETVVLNSAPVPPLISPAVICAGSPTLITASGGTLYEFLINGVPQGPPSATNTFNAPALNAADVICVRSYPGIPFNFDGNLTEQEWGNPWSTSAGGPAASGFGVGNNLDAIKIRNGSGYLFGGIASNVLNNSNNRVLLFIDCKPGGFNNLAGWVNRSNAPYYSVENLSSGIVFDPGFAPDYVLAMNQAGGDAFFDLYDMVNNTNNYIGSASASPMLGFIGNSGTGDYSKGFEFGIPLTALSNPAGSISYFSMIVNDPGFGIPTTISNQFLTPCGPAELNYGNAAVNFSAALPNPVSLAMSADCSEETCVTVVNSITPVFTPIGTICQGAPVPLLPLISNNGINGTWSPSVISNAASGSYTFTPDPGQCAGPVTINVNIQPTPVITPIYHD